jgi:NADH-quinone oxidoreductase subunit M
VQNDLKSLAAYGTLGHVSVAVLGIFAFTVAGIDGGIYQTLNEGLGGSAFFMLLGLLYERFGTYDMRELGGLAAKFPWMVTMFVITTLAVVGLPMLNGFVSEFLVFSGTMQSSVANHTAWTVVATSGVILTASYMLDRREHLALWPLMLVFLAMGVLSPVWTRAIDTAGTVLAQPFGLTVRTVYLYGHPAVTPALPIPANTTEGGQR